MSSTASNEQIFEAIVTTVDAAGRANVAPMGVRYGDGLLVLKPFRPSATLSNVLETRHAVVNVTTDTRVFAGAVTGRRDWPLRRAERIPGVRLDGALRHIELALHHVNDDAQRPTLSFVPVHAAEHAPFLGFNRAQAAVIEGAVLVSRLSLLPRDKIEREMAYLQIAIDKTAGPHEHEAWGWLTAAVAAHASMLPAASGVASPRATP